jgi:DNA-binding LytR/AlgR family response regulator
MKVAIIEDEHFSANRLKRMLTKIDDSINVVKVLSSVEGSIDWLSKHPDVDLLFVDIHLEDRNSFDIFSGLDISTPIVFTTAYDQYALQAFKLKSIDYLLKPIDADELARSIEKYRLFFENPKVELGGSIVSSEPKSRFLVKLGSQLLSVLAKDVAYFKSEQKLLFLINNEGKKYVLDVTLDQIQSQLDASSFFRVNRNTIVAFDCIDKIHVYFNGRLKLELNPPYPEETIVSRERVQDFKTWLGM